jgi:outer membrane protein insertion porin family
VSFSVQFTPPYSLFNDKNYQYITPQDKYKFIEYHKWKFNASWFTKLAGNLVLNAKLQYGFLGYYNKNIGYSPFERFYLGGDGMAGFAYDGREIVGLRGYGNQTLPPPPRLGTGNIGGTVFDKYTLELRYPVSLNPSATIYVLGFAEAGNAWHTFKEFNPFVAYRSAGAGVRISCRCLECWALIGDMVLMNTELSRRQRQPLPIHHWAAVLRSGTLKSVTLPIIFYFCKPNFRKGKL